MLTAKPDDEKYPARTARSGHGAASLIPHLNGRQPFTPSDGDGVTEAGQPSQPAQLAEPQLPQTK